MKSFAIAAVVLTAVVFIAGFVLVWMVSKGQR